MGSRPISPLRPLATLTLMGLGGFASADQRDVVVGPPEAMDANGDGDVSIVELHEFNLSEEEFLHPVREMFRRLDPNGNRALSAEEREAGLAPGNHIRH